VFLDFVLLGFVSSALGKRLAEKRPVPDMTYNVFGGTLNPAQSINQAEKSISEMGYFVTSKSTRKPS